MLPPVRARGLQNVDAQHLADFAPRHFMIAIESIFCWRWA